MRVALGSQRESQKLATQKCPRESRGSFIGTNAGMQCHCHFDSDGFLTFM